MSTPNAEAEPQQPNQLGRQVVPWCKPMSPERLQKVRAVFEKARVEIIKAIVEQRRQGTNGL